MSDDCDRIQNHFSFVIFSQRKKKIFVFHLHKENIDANALRWLVNFKKEHIIPNDSKNLWPIIWKNDIEEKNTATDLFKMYYGLFTILAKQ